MTTNLVPAADTRINGSHPTNTYGGDATIVSGTQGPRSSFELNRVLLRFEFAGIPSNMPLTSVRLTVHVARAPEGAPPVTFALHRMLTSWTEGGATWNAPGSAGGVWGAPGMAAGVDYVAAASASLLVNLEGAYTFDSNSNLLRDVEQWLVNPATNWGWALITTDEAIERSARRFGARESGPTAATLEVRYGSDQVRLTHPAVVSNRFVFRFDGTAGNSYAVERLHALGTNNWTVISNVPVLSVPTGIWISDPLLPTNAFYRVRQQ